MCGHRDNELDYDQVKSLKYADAVLRETLRLCPIGTV